jgi:hypothetical protein
LIQERDGARFDAARQNRIMDQMIRETQLLQWQLDRLKANQAAVSPGK